MTLQNGNSKIIYESIKTMDYKAIMFIGPIVLGILWAILDSHNNKIFVSKEVYQADQNRICKSLDKLEAGQEKLIDHMLNR